MLGTDFAVPGRFASRFLRNVLKSSAAARESDKVLRL